MTAFTLAPGERVTLTAPGTVPYYHRLHPWPHSVIVAQPCRRGTWCDWAVLGQTAVCTIGGEVAEVGTDGEIQEGGGSRA